MKHAYEQFVAGTSISDIARFFNAAGAFGLTGRPWTPTTVSLFLRSPRNAGIRVHTHADPDDEQQMVTDIIGPGTWEGLVEAPLWRAAQTKLNAPGRSPGRKTVRRHLLTGVLRCGKCGRYLSGMQTLSETITYRCRSSVSLTGKGCGGVGVAAHLIEPLLLELVVGHLAKPEAMELLQRQDSDAAEVEDVNTKIAVLQQERDFKCPRECRKGNLTSTQLKTITDDINEEIAELKARQEDDELVRVFEGIPLGERVAKVERSIKALTPDRYRAVLVVLMDPVIKVIGRGGYVFDEDRLVPRWKRGDGTVTGEEFDWEAA